MHYMIASVIYTWRAVSWLMFWYCEVWILGEYIGLKLVGMEWDVHSLSKKNQVILSIHYRSMVSMQCLCHAPLSRISSSSRPYIHTFTKSFHLLTCILAINVKVVPRRILPALYPTTPVNEPPWAFNSAPAIGVPISPLTY
jgi:hypothetical protein